MEGNAEYRRMLDKLFTEHQSKDIFQCMNSAGDIRHISYGGVYEDIKKFKNKIDWEHLLPGDRVIILDSHAPSVMQMFLTATYWNLSPVMMDPGIPEAEMDSLIQFLEPKAIFSGKQVLVKLTEKVRSEIPVFDVRDVDNAYPLICDLKSAASERRTAPGNPDTAVIILSSGTTSKMKAAEISYSAFMNSLRQDTRISRICEKDNMLMVFPLFHVSGLDSAMTILLKGNTLMMVDEFHPAELSRVLKTYAPQAFGMVPKVFEIMVQKLEQELKKKSKLVQAYYRISFNIASFFNRHFGFHGVGKILMRPFATALFGKNIRILPVGASACDPHTAETLINMGLQWFYVYASTECGVPIASVQAGDHYPCDTVGRIDSVKNVDICILRPDVNGVGEICVKTDQMMTGYFHDPELTKSSFENGYFKTGDLGYVDHDGYLHLTGRSKETILLQTGKKIAPTDLEMILNQADFKYETAICGAPDKTGGFDKIHVFVCDRNYSDEEKNLCRKNILEIFRKNAKQYPVEEIHFIENIPKTAIGKVKRTLLREMVCAGSEIKNTENVSRPTAKSVWTEEELLKLIISLLPNGGGLQYASDTHLKDIDGMDSLKMMEILTEIEKETGVFIGEEIVNMSSIGDMVSYIYIRRRAGKEKGDRA